MPLIFPRENFDLGRALGMVSYPLEAFNGKPGYIAEKLQFFLELAFEFKEKILCWREFMPPRSIIEDVFKVAKKTFSLERMHRYTMRSVKKACAFSVLLTGVVISLGFNTKEDLQRLSEW